MSCPSVFVSHGGKSRELFTASFIPATRAVENNFHSVNE